MKTVEVSLTLAELTLRQNRNLEYFLSETLGYISDERAKQLGNRVSIITGETATVELSDEICAEIQSTFDDSITLSQAINITLLCGFVFGGV